MILSLHSLCFFLSFLFLCSFRFSVARRALGRRCPHRLNRPMSCGRGYFPAQSFARNIFATDSVWRRRNKKPLKANVFRGQMRMGKTSEKRICRLTWCNEENPCVDEENPRICKENPHADEENPHTYEENPYTCEENPRATRKILMLKRKILTSLNFCESGLIVASRPCGNPSRL